jgi:hypothetical protein
MCFKSRALHVCLLRQVETRWCRGTCERCCKKRCDCSAGYARVLCALFAFAVALRDPYYCVTVYFIGCVDSIP